MLEKTTSKLISKKDVIDLFAKMEAIWRDRWLSNTKNCNINVDIEIWKIALGSLTISQINKGISWCMVNCDYPPSIAQFKKAALGIKDPDVAYVQQETDPIAKLALSKCDTLILRQSPVTESRKHFVAVYKSIVEQLLLNEITL